MKIEIDLDVQSVAELINESVGSDVETAKSITRWVQDNGPQLPGLLRDAIVSDIAEAY